MPVECLIAGWGVGGGWDPLLLLEVEQLAVPPMTDKQETHQLLIYSSVSEEVFQSYLWQAVPLT